MHLTSNHSARWLAATASVLALAAFPGAAAAAGPLPAPTPCPVVGNSPCYSTAPVVSPSNEIAAPPEGRILSATTGAWSGTPAPSLTYQWYDCATSDSSSCTKIPGATSRTYTVASSDVKQWLAFVVTATGSGTGAWVYESTNPATAAIPLNRSAPTLSGNTQDGQALTSTTGVWAGTMPITGYTYQWDRCSPSGICANVNAPNSPTYALTDKDVGDTIKVGVEATNAAGTGGATTCPGAVVLCPVFSKASVLITPFNNATPTISGTPQAGNTLTESHGSWLPSNSTLAYQWESCDASGAGCTTIPGATSQTYKLTSGDVGHTIVVQEIASENGATSSPAASAATSVVQAAPSSGGGSGGNPGGGSGGNPGSAPPAPTGGQPAPAGNAPSPTVVNAGQLRVLLSGALAVHGRAARIGALLKRGGYSFTFSAPAAGRLTIAWYRVQHGKRTLVATVNALLHRTGAARLELVLTRSGRNLLRHAGAMTLAARGGFTPTGQGTTSASKTIKLIR